MVDTAAVAADLPAIRVYMTRDAANAAKPDTSTGPGYRVPPFPVSSFPIPYPRSPIPYPLSPVSCLLSPVFQNSRSRAAHR